MTPAQIVQQHDSSAFPIAGPPQKRDRAFCPDDHPETPSAVQLEQQRLAALDRHDILDTPKEEAFDRITRLAQKLFNVPFVIITMIDAHRAWSKSLQGMELSEGPRNLSFCQYTIRGDGPLVVPDATLEPKFSDSRYVVGEPYLRFYAGIPLATRDGQNLGTLCLIDTKPREFSSDQTELLFDLARLAMDELELRLLSTTDSLTGALSRRAFKEQAHHSTALALRHQHELSCIAFDLDHFKSINDTYGHAVGDEVLAAVVKTCKAELRETDLLGRLGGEEFAVLLPHTSRSAAFEVAEKLRGTIEQLSFGPEGKCFRVSASFGVSSMGAATRDVDTLLKHADDAVYTAKAAGRNRCVAWQSNDAEVHILRRRVMKGGKIYFNGRTASIDCTVRGLSPEGARLDVSSTLGVPNKFTLVIRADDFESECQVLSRTDRHIEVEYC